MLDIPLNKALVAVEYHSEVEMDEGKCEGCFFNPETFDCSEICCNYTEREDDKNVIFKLVDLQEEKRKLIDAMREVCNEDCPNHNGTVVMDDDKIDCDRCGIILLTNKLGINRVGEGISR